MTNRRDREHDRAVREYKREHPGITLDQARKAVAARDGRQPGLPDRIPTAPLPRPAERLEGYVQRVAAAAGVQRHRAMVLLGLAPGTSATARLDHLAAGPLPEDTVRALTAATGMTTDQARALTTSPTGTAAAAAYEALQHTPEATFPAGYFRRGGEGKTTTSRGLSTALALALAQQANMTSPDSPDAPDQPPTDAAELARLLAEATMRPLPFDLPGGYQYLLLQPPPTTDLDWPADAA